MLTAIRQWVIKTMTKGNTGVVQTMPKPQIIEMNVQITAQRLMQNGINPNDLKTVGQVENVVNQIEQPKVNVNPGMTSVKKADVFDIDGNRIPEGSNIMGGKEINQKNLNEELMKTDNPYSELVNTPRPKTIAEREADVLAGMEKNNKEMVQRIRDRKRAEFRKSIVNSRCSRKNSRPYETISNDATDGFHFYFMLLKFGFGRATSDAANEVREKRISREDAVKFVQKYDEEFPIKFYKKFLEYCYISEEEFIKICDSWRSSHIWIKKNNKWKLRKQVN